MRQRCRNLPIFLTAVALLLASCNDDESLLQMFDGPGDVAVMRPNDIVSVPVGFVTNYRSGLIVKLDLKHETYLRDVPLGSWIRSLPIATGRDRFLDQIAVAHGYTAEDEENGIPESFYVTIFASDSSRDQLLVIPYLDTEISGGDHCLPDPACHDDSSGSRQCDMPRYPICLYDEAGGPLNLRYKDSPGSIKLDKAGELTVSEFWLREGHTTTETWTAQYDAVSSSFQLIGSRSGLQKNTAKIGETYYSDYNEIEFLISGSREPENGESFTLRTDSGIREIPVDGLIEDLVVAPEQGLLFATLQGLDTVADEDDSGEVVSGRLGVMDLSGLESRDYDGLELSFTQAPLCYGEADFSCSDEALALDFEAESVCISKPMAMELDESNQMLYISDASEAGVVFKVDLSEEPLRYWPLTGFEPNLDVAYVEESNSEADYQHLFVGNIGTGTVSLFDTRGCAFVDVNPYTAAMDPVRLHSPIRGLASARAPVALQEYSDEGAQLQAVLVAATTYEGDVAAIKAENGCRPSGVPGGAYVYSASSGLSVDLGAPSNPSFSVDSQSNVVASLNPCGGITRSETWTFTYDELIQGYRVHGSASNEFGEYQERIAYEDERYVSDNAEISVLVRSGTLPTTDGDELSLTVLSGLSPIALGESSASGGALPGDLQIYDETYGDRNSAWTVATFRSVAVVPAPGNDVVYKLDLRLPGSYSSAIMESFY